MSKRVNIQSARTHDCHWQQGLLQKPRSKSTIDTLAGFACAPIGQVIRLVLYRLSLFDPECQAQFGCVVHGTFVPFAYGNYPQYRQVILHPIDQTKTCAAQVEFAAVRLRGPCSRGNSGYIEPAQKNFGKSSSDAPIELVLFLLDLGQKP